VIHEISIQSSVREEFVDITSRVQQIVTASGHQSGYVICSIPHTTAGITINENADPDVCRDLIYKLRKDIPQSDGYQHAEGNSDAHLKASLMGCFQQLLFEHGRLVLGRWQGIYFCEFDGPRNRKLIIKVIADA
jgi:secondary thiamine-phosphate synthase enzyme